MYVNCLEQGKKCDDNVPSANVTTAGNINEALTMSFLKEII